MNLIVVSLIPITIDTVIFAMYMSSSDVTERLTQMDDSLFEKLYAYLDVIDMVRHYLNGILQSLE